MLIAIAFVSGVLSTVVLFWFLGAKSQVKRMTDYTSAKEELRKYSMTAELYLPTIGEEDPKLRELLDKFAFSGYMVRDSNGVLVGKLVPNMQKRKPNLKLVVSNS